MLSWQVGRVKITRIVEMDLPVPATFMAGATPVELRKLPWLYPHFVKDDGSMVLSIHALLGSESFQLRSHPSVSSMAWSCKAPVDAPTRRGGSSANHFFRLLGLGKALASHFSWLRCVVTR